MSFLLNPVFEVEWESTRVDPAVANFNVESAAGGSADLAVLLFNDPEEALIPKLLRGNKLKIRWGYQDDSELLEIFDGVIRTVDPKGLQASVEALDWQTILQAKRIVQTWEHATPAEVVTDMLTGTGLGLETASTETEINRFPVHGLTVVEALKQLVRWIEKETEEQFRFYVRGGKLVFAPADDTQQPVYTFETGENIIQQRPGKLGLTVLETIAVPVQHDQVVSIDGSNWFVEEAAYRWTTGGRTILQVRPCATS